MSLIIKNITSGGGAVTVSLDDLGLELPSQATYDLANEEASDVYRSTDLIAAIVAGEIAVLDPLDDVTQLSGAQSQEALTAHNDTNWRLGKGARVGDISDVSSGGIINGQALIYNAGTYSPGNVAIGVDRVQAYYVNKHGNDSNTGLRPELAFLTFGAAITAVNAQTPSATNRFSINCDDSGVYDEDFTVPGWCHIMAPEVKIEGTVTMTDNSELTVHEVEADVNNGAIVKTTGGGAARVTAEVLRATGTGDTVVNGAAVTGVLICSARQIFVENGTGVIDNSTAAAGHIHVDIEDLYITGTGSGIDSNTTNGFVVGKVSHILEIGGGVGNGTAFEVDTGRIDMLIGYVDADIAYNVSGNGRLRIIVNELGGTRTQTAGGAVVDILEANSLRWITITNSDSPYSPRRIEFLSIDTTGGAVEVDLDGDASDGDVMWFQDAAGTFKTNNLTIDANGNTIQGAATLTVNVNGQSGFAVFRAADSNWSVTFNSEAAFSPDNLIYVTKNGNDTTGDGTFSNPFLTIKRGVTEALTRVAITPVPTTVKVLDGIYDEINPINITGTNSQFVQVQGTHEFAVFARPTVATQDMFTMTSGSATMGPSLYRLTVDASNLAAFKTNGQSGVVMTGPGRFVCDKTNILSCGIGIDSGNGVTTDQEAVFDFATIADCTTAVDAKGDGVQALQVAFLRDNTTGVNASGNVRVEMGNWAVQGADPGDTPAGTGLVMNNSAVMVATSGTITNLALGLQANDTSDTTLATTVFGNNTLDFDQVNATAIVQIQGFASKSKTSITDGANVSLNYVNTDDGDFIVGSKESDSTPGLEFRVRDFDGRVFIGDMAENYNAPTNTVGGSRTVNLIDTNGNFRVWRWQAAPGLHPAFEWLKGVNTFAADDEGDAPITAITAGTDTITIDVSGTDYNDPLVDTPQGADRTTMAARVFYAGAELRVNGTASNNGDYVVSSSVYNSGPQTIDVVVTTDITVTEGAGGTAVFGGGAGRPDGVSTYVDDPAAAIAAGVGDVHWDMLLRETDSFAIRRRTGGAGKEHFRFFRDRAEFLASPDYDPGGDPPITLIVEGVTGADDYFTIRNSGAGLPEIEAVGADVDINILMTPKGVGTVLVPVGYDANIVDQSLITKSYADGILTEDLATVQARRTTTLALPVTPTWGDVTLDATDVENNAAALEHNNTNTQVIDVKEDGLYRINYAVSADDEVTCRVVDDGVGGTSVIPGSTQLTGDTADVNDVIVQNSPIIYVELTSGDELVLQVQAQTTAEVMQAEALFSVQKCVGGKGDTGAPGTGATIEVEDEGASLGTTFTTINFIGDGVSAVANGTTADITIPYKNTFFHGHNGLVTQTFTTTATTINFATNIRQDADYVEATVVGGSEVTINEPGTNWFKVTYDLGIDISTGTSRSSSRSELQVNTVAVPGSQGYGYHRQSSNAEMTVSKTVTLQLAQNDVVRVQSVRIAGTSTLITLANSCTLTIEKVDAP